LKTCPICEHEFSPTNKRRKYDSDTCKAEAKRRKQHEYYLQWSRTDPERVSRYRRNYQGMSQDYSKRYYQKNKEKILAKHKLRREAGRCK